MVQLSDQWEYRDQCSLATSAAISTLRDSSAQAPGHVDLPKFRFIRGQFSVFPILLSWDDKDLAAGARVDLVPSEKVAQMTFFGSIWLETQEKVILGGSRRLLIFSRFLIFEVIGQVGCWMWVLLLPLILSHAAVGQGPGWSGGVPWDSLIIPIRFNKAFIEFLYMISMRLSFTTLFLV